uniref:Uncharacterized protein n=1 Tax=Arundo donax TaxID=35708 RepID=A0A0A8Y9E0_ARUDO
MLPHHFDRTHVSFSEHLTCLDRTYCNHFCFYVGLLAGLFLV